MRLILGVVDVAYSDASGGDGLTTTGDVAEILEKNYHVMETFFELKKEQIAGVLADAMAESIQLLASGQRIDTEATLTYSGDQKIESMFRAFLTANEMEKLHFAFTGSHISDAAARGVSKRRKRPYARRDARPAFIDTGLYMASMRAWTQKGAPVGV